MAKVGMLCPFSGELCEECPLYRGRHYYLCFCSKYRGCLSKSGKIPPPLRANFNGKFEMPAALLASVRAIDPFAMDSKDSEKED
jgi:hypothetical protein